MATRLLTPDEAADALSALAEQLQARGARFELVVIGGTALVSVGLVERATRDVDVVALAHAGGLQRANPLPPELADALALVARDLALPADWLNAAPTSLLDFGLPEGFLSRVVTRDYGPALTIHFAGRLDQIHFKLFALVDNQAARHEADLRALEPTRTELIAAARWARTHDPSEGFRDMLLETLDHLGVRDADVGA